MVKVSYIIDKYKETNFFFLTEGEFIKDCKIEFAAVKN